MITDKIISLCTSDKTVLSELQQDPTQSPGSVLDKLYPSNEPHIVQALLEKLYIGGTPAPGLVHPTAEDLERALKCGKFGPRRPSDLFLKIYHDVLQTLERNDRIGLVSPPLLGSSGVLPLTVISIIPDIMRHYANLIVKAEKEVFLATNYWAASYASKIVTDALRELSNRAGKRGEKVIVKVLYDRGNLHQVCENHLPVEADEYTGEAVQLPHPDEIPHIDLEVVNYHRPIVGTFHAKYMVVDRKIAILNSNNIQDVPNLEMMCHFEGPIVESLYDMAMLSWHNAFKPPLPLIVSPPSPVTTFDFADRHGDSDGPIAPTASSEEEVASTKTLAALAYQIASSTVTLDTKKQVHKEESKPKGPPIIYDQTFSGEARRVQATLKEMSDITRHLNTVIQPNTKGDEQNTEWHEKHPFTPYILHPRHDPFPIAMVNRQPFGQPGHEDVVTPQNQAWLAALRYAEKKVFIQTPTLNVAPLMEGILDAVRRGVTVILYICIGYNDAGELLPFQGGTNEQAVNKMYQELSKPEEKNNLQVYWYTGKDMSKPIHAISKKRTCHIKLMTVDDCIGIQGSGNQDTQSWYHSQEVNVMIDSPQVVAEWHQGLRSNQNTEIHGRVGTDGIWLDGYGKPLADATGGDEGFFSTFKGITGAIQRVRGEGGF